MKTNIIRVKYEDEQNPKTFSGKAYSYYTIIELKVGDIVIAPTKYGTSIARVSQIDIEPKEIESFKNQMKLITKKLDKTKFLNSDIIEKVA